MFRTLLKSKIHRVAVTHCDKANRQMDARQHVPTQLI